MNRQSWVCLSIWWYDTVTGGGSLHWLIRFEVGLILLCRMVQDRTVENMKGYVLMMTMIIIYDDDETLEDDTTKCGVTLGGDF